MWLASQFVNIFGEFMTSREAEARIVLKLLQEKGIDVNQLGDVLRLSPYVWSLCGKRALKALVRTSERESLQTTATRYACLHMYDDRGDCRLCSSPEIVVR